MARLTTQNILPILEAALERWWNDTVAALPAAWRRVFGPGRWLVFVAGQEAVPGGTLQPVAVALPEGEFLLRLLELPLLPWWQLPRLMRFEAPRHIPLPLAEARVDFRIVQRDFTAGRMVVELAITRVETVRKVEALAQMAGGRPEAVLLHTSQGPWYSRRLLERAWREVLETRRYQKLFLRTALPIVLGLACIMGAQHWAGRLAASRDAAVAAARAQAAGVEPLRQQLASLNDQISFLANARTQPSAAVLSEEVAKLLPDDAWLQEFDIEAQTVRLVGTAGHATDLLTVFSASPLFSDVRFEAPLTPAPMTGGSQFDLVMTRN